MKLTKIILLATSIHVSFLNTVQAASFDCAKASSKTEKAICNNPELSKLDEKMADAYKAAVAVDKNTKASQIAWIKETAKCADEACMIASYNKRIAELAVQKNANKSSNVEVVSNNEKERYFAAGGCLQKINSANERKLKIDTFTPNELQSMATYWLKKKEISETGAAADACLTNIMIGDTKCLKNKKVGELAEAFWLGWVTGLQIDQMTTNDQLLSWIQRDCKKLMKN